MGTLARRVQAVVDAYAAGSPGQPDWQSARMISSYRSPEDAIPPSLHSWAARKTKEEVELAQSRAKVREARVRSV